MCEFASFILTIDKEFWGPTDSHSDIIEHHKIIEDGARGPNIVRVEITPPVDDPRATFDKWIYCVDQDILPDWHTEDPGRSEDRARSALQRRAAAEYWMQSAEGQSVQVGYAGTATAGYAGTATAGYAGTATAGYAGTATAGDAGTATAGARGTATAGARGTATAGARGTATAGARGTATAGYAGTATAGARGTATAGDDGTATAGDDGTATAGDDAILVVKYWDGKRYRLATGYTGEDGIDAGKKYRADPGSGKLVETA